MKWWPFVVVLVLFMAYVYTQCTRHPCDVYNNAPQRERCEMRNAYEDSRP